jgi:hypothetical protein
MQRRAVAIYVALFLVVGAASYSLIATATAPTIGFENPDHELSEGDQFSVGDRQYTVASITAEVEGGGGGGHGGGGGELVRSGRLTWTNDSARYTATWENDSTTTFEGTEYRVATGGDSGTVSLVETVNRSAILQEDPDARNELVTQNGTEYVVIEQGGDLSLRPAAEYFPEPSSTEFQEGETLQYEGNTTTVASVTDGGATLAWTAPRTNGVEIGDEANVTLDGQQYVTHFPDNSTLTLGDYGTYDRQTAQIDTYHKHVSGLWGISIMSFATAIMLIGMAYMPSRY